MKIGEKVFNKESDVRNIAIGDTEYELARESKFYSTMYVDSEELVGKPKCRVSYTLHDITTKEVVAWLNASSITAGREVELEYATDSEYRGRGIASALVDTALHDIYERGVTDKLVQNDEYGYKPCENVFLSISQDNVPSYKVAFRTGFDISQEATGNFVANMSRDRFLSRNMEL
ncbi:MAG: GNAT family N-acetyltransferase [Clostridiales bacterium]|nr:GNAT family N-acetyltransferase [Clostridiales bacterium]